MQRKKNPIYRQSAYWLSVVIIGLVTGIGLQFAQAVWTNPTTTAPGGNVLGPLTTSIGSQWKTGPLGINTGSAPLAGFGLSVGGNAAIGNTLSAGGNISSSTQISSPRYCIGSSCITAWPSGGVADNLGNHTATQDLNMNGRNILNGGNRISMGGVGSASYYYGDSTNLAARQNGGFYVQNAAGSALAPIYAATGSFSQTNVSGNSFIGGKAYSAATVATDSSTTLATKGYVDSKVATGNIKLITGTGCSACPYGYAAIPGTSTIYACNMKSDTGTIILGSTSVNSAGPGSRYWCQTNTGGSAFSFWSY